jgi:tRNA modification GTPase
MYRADTIVACATAAGRSAIAIVRLSGSDACDIASRMLRGRSGELITTPPWRLARFAAVDPTDSRVVDDVLAVRMAAPATYTGEDIVEIHCHGSPLVTDALLRMAVSAGARLADPGEFTRRAVLNGRMDLVQAEAVAELIEAPVLAGVKAAWQRLEGGLSHKLERLRGSLLTVLAALEAHIDFSDDDLPDEEPAELSRMLTEIREECEALVVGFAVARREGEGYRAVLLGKPNVGKSSLLNALVGSDRAVVTDEPGTTRDVVTERLDLEGFALIIADTAGLRDARGQAERLAITRSRAAVAEADVLLCVFDASRPLDEHDQEILRLATNCETVIKVLNKCDLPPGLASGDERLLTDRPGPVVRSSAVFPDGCDVLRDALRSTLRKQRPDASVGVGLGRERHHGALQRALGAIDRAIELLANDTQSELAAAEIRQGLHDLACVTRVLDDDQVLDVIFSRFCIGK